MVSSQQQIQQLMLQWQQELFFQLYLTEEPCHSHLERLMSVCPQISQLGYSCCQSGCQCLHTLAQSHRLENHILFCSYTKPKCLPNLEIVFLKELPVCGPQCHLIRESWINITAVAVTNISPQNQCTNYLNDSIFECCKFLCKCTSDRASKTILQLRICQISTRAPFQFSHCTPLPTPSITVVVRVQQRLNAGSQTNMADKPRTNRCCDEVDTFCTGKNLLDGAIWVAVSRCRELGIYTVKPQVLKILGCLAFCLMKKRTRKLAVSGKKVERKSTQFHCLSHEGKLDCVVYRIREQRAIWTPSFKHCFSLQSSEVKSFVYIIINIFCKTRSSYMQCHVNVKCWVGPKLPVTGYFRRVPAS